MIFSIRNLGFELGSLLLEGWAAFAARVVCAALLLVLGWLVRQLLSRKVCPALLRRSWRLAGTPILLRSFAVPVFLGLVGGIAGMLLAAKGYALLWPYCLMQQGMNSNRSEDMLAGKLPLFFLACGVWLLVIGLTARLLLEKRDVKA